MENCNFTAEVILLQVSTFFQKKRRLKSNFGPKYFECKNSLWAIFGIVIVKNEIYSVAT